MTSKFIVMPLEFLSEGHDHRFFLLFDLPIEQMNEYIAVFVTGVGVRAIANRCQ